MSPRKWVKVALPSIVACLAALLALCATASRAAEVDDPGLRENIQRFVAAAQERSGAPGLTAAVALPNGEVWEFAAGFSDVEAGLRMRPDDRLAAGSIGKSFMAALAAALVTEGV